jgi:hypothetical protein
VGSNFTAVGVAAMATVSTSAAGASTDKLDKADLIHCELLYFVAGSVDCRPVAVIKSSIMDFYRDDEILLAKQKLATAVEKIDGVPIQPFTRKRIGENKIRASVDDILSIFTCVDEYGCREQLPLFCAAVRSRVPVLTDELSDIGAMRMELRQLREQFDQLSARLVDMSLNTCQCRASVSTTSGSLAKIAPSDHRASARRYSSLPQDGVTNVVADDALHPVHGDTETVLIGNAGFSPSKATDFADTVKNNIDKLDEFQLVERQKKKAKNAKIIGGISVTTAFKGVCKKSVVCVNRLEAGTSVDSITSHLRDKGVEVVSCFELKAKNQSQTIRPDAGTSVTSMRLCIWQYDIKKVMDPGMWPKGVLVRPWSFKQKTDPVFVPHSPGLVTATTA